MDNKIRIDRSTPIKSLKIGDRIGRNKIDPIDRNN